MLRNFVDIYRKPLCQYRVDSIEVLLNYNTEIIDIHARGANLSTTIKSVVNGINEEGMGNDTDGARIYF